MSRTDDLITFPKLLSRLTALTPHMPGLIRGAILGKSSNPRKRQGLDLRFQQATEKNPNGVAVGFEDRYYTYREFNAWANQLAYYFLSIGLKKGDTIAVNIENRPELLITVLAAAKIGVCSALVNTSQRGRVLTHSINLVEPKLLIVGAELVDAVEEVRNDLKLNTDQFFAWADQDTHKDAGSVAKGYTNIGEELKAFGTDNPPQSGSNYLNDPLFYIYTSGTTGLPKAVVFNHGRWEKGFNAFGFAAVRLNSNDRLYATLPFYHATGIVVGWASVVAGRGGVILARRFSASGFWDDVRKHDCTAFAYVGELCRYLHERPRQANDSDNKIRVIVGNGLRPSIWKDFKERFGIERVVELYGSSEGNVAFTNVFNFDNTVGYTPVPYAIVKFDKDTEEPIRGKDGLLVRAKKGEPGLLIGKITKRTPYDGYTDKSKTEETIIRDAFKKGDAYFNTGDLMRDIGYKHAQFVDRLGDTFRWKGENVSTTEVEHILDAFDGIAESVVYGVEIPDCDGRAGMAQLRLSEGQHIDDLDFAALAQYLRAELPAYAVPLFLRLRDSEFEATGTFKHLKTDLKKEKYDLSQVGDDKVYVLLPSETAFQPLTAEMQQGVDDGAYRL